VTPWNSSRMIRVLPKGGTDNETIKVHGRADHRGSARTGDWPYGSGLVPQARAQRSDVLQLEGQVRRHGRIRRQGVEGLRRRQRQARAAAGLSRAAHLMRGIDVGFIRHLHSYKVSLDPSSSLTGKIHADFRLCTRLSRLLPNLRPTCKISVCQWMVSRLLSL
jgi:hypothetical protein